MVELEVGKVYTTKELAEALEISYKAFRNNKNAYLKSLSMAYDYEVKYKGRGAYYTIVTKVGEYEKPQRKDARVKTDKVIKKFINEVIERDPMQTAANINRIAWKNSDTHPTEIALLGLKCSTTGEYTRLNLREMYGTQVGEGGTDGIIEKKVWCRLDKDNDCYAEMAPETVDKFYACFDKARKDQKKSDLNIVADYDNGLITREEMRDKLEATTINAFKEGQEMFYMKYGFHPIRVPVYLKRAWLEPDKAYKPVS